MDTTQLMKQNIVLQELGDRLRHLHKMRKLRQLDMEDLGVSYKYC